MRPGAGKWQREQTAAVPLRGRKTVRGGEKRRHFRRIKAVPTEPGGGAAGAGRSMGEDAVKDSIAVSIS